MKAWATNTLSNKFTLVKFTDSFKVNIFTKVFSKTGTRPQLWSEAITWHEVATPRSAHNNSDVTGASCRSVLRTLSNIHYLTSCLCKKYSSRLCDRVLNRSIDINGIWARFDDKLLKFKLLKLLHLNLKNVIS